MLDIWGFLLQTLTVSGVAVLLLVVKALFRDKLPPKWQLAVWGVLGVVMLIPAGALGRYNLFRWQIPVEIVKSWVGDYSFTRVIFPIPVITSVPDSFAEWVFAAYVTGVVAHLVKYAVSYVRLRLAVREGKAPSGERLARVARLASEQDVRLGRVVEARGLPSAFVCGVIRPTLVIPAGQELDDKVILHELFHLKNRDTLLSVIICTLRCLHWCNPLIAWCAERALGDVESRCDQLVLESLEGEERREYGRILLSMANERFSKTPGSTCINNGGGNISERIENIARFKKYPQGMRLVSICILILLVFPLAIGSQAASFHEIGDSVSLTLASARSTPCTTPAGAFDAYAKSVLDRNGYYRAMCAPEEEQADILCEMLSRDGREYPLWDPGLDEWADGQSGYYIYNLVHAGDDTYEGLLAVRLIYPPNGKPEEINMMYLAVQNVRVERQGVRWVAIPLEDFRYIESRIQTIKWGCPELPGITYSGEASDFEIGITYQTVHTVDSTVKTQNDNFLFGSASYYDTTPVPNAEFTDAAYSQYVRSTYLGCDEDKDGITQIALSVAPVHEGERRPTDLRDPLTELAKPSGDEAFGSSSLGEMWMRKTLKPGWSSTITFNGGGGSADPTGDIESPEYFAADLYLNGERVANLDLRLREVTGE